MFEQKKKLRKASSFIGTEFSHFSVCISLEIHNIFCYVHAFALVKLLWLPPLLLLRLSVIIIVIVVDDEFLLLCKLCVDSGKAKRNEARNSVVDFIVFYVPKNG